MRRLACCSRSSSSARSRCEASISSSMRLNACTSTPISSRVERRGADRVVAAVGNVARRVREARDRRGDDAAAVAATAGTPSAGPRSRMVGDRGRLGADARALRLEIVGDQQHRAGVAAARQLFGDVQPVGREPGARTDGEAGQRIGVGSRNDRDANSAPLGRYRQASCVCGWIASISSVSAAAYGSLNVTAAAVFSSTSAPASRGRPACRRGSGRSPRSRTRSRRAPAPRR